MKVLAHKLLPQALLPREIRLNQVYSLPPKKKKKSLNNPEKQVVVIFIYMDEKNENIGGK